MPEPNFPLAISAWPGPKLRIISVIGTRIATFPMAFLTTCGDNTWLYINYVLSLLVTLDPLHPASLFDPHTRLPVDTDGPTRPGTFEYIEQGMIDLCLVSGYQKAITRPR